MDNQNIDNLVDRIAAGEATLLSIEDICQRLGISRTTLDRWVRNGGGKLSSTSGSRSLAMQIGAGMALSKTLQEVADGLGETTISFPSPDIRIGNSPKWEMETFKSWLRANAKQ